MLADFGILHFVLFLSSALIFTLTPGLDTVFVLNRAVSQGKQIGIMAGLGVATGVVVHTFLAAFGLAAIVAKSAWLFTLIKYLGAAYLIYLGISSVYHSFFTKDLPAPVSENSSSNENSLKSHANIANANVEDGATKLNDAHGSQAHSPQAHSSQELWRAFRSGLFTNVLNPKVVLFFLAFFPQFITVDARQDFAPYLILGMSYAAISAVWLVMLGALAGSVLTCMLRGATAQRWMDRVSGVVFVAMGIKVAVSK